MLCGGGKVGPRSYLMGKDLNFVSASLHPKLFSTVNTRSTGKNAVEVRYQAEADRTLGQGEERGPPSDGTVDALFVVSGKC